MERNGKSVQVWRKEWRIVKRVEGCEGCSEGKIFCVETGEGRAE